MRSGGQGDILPLHLSNQSNESSSMKQSRTCYLYAVTRKTALKCHGVFMIICSQAEVIHTEHGYFMAPSAKHGFERKKNPTTTDLFINAQFLLTVHFTVA